MQKAAAGNLIYSSAFRFSAIQASADPAATPADRSRAAAAPCRQPIKSSKNLCDTLQLFDNIYMLGAVAFTIAAGRAVCWAAVFFGEIAIGLGSGPGSAESVHIVVQ